MTYSQELKMDMLFFFSSAKMNLWNKSNMTHFTEVKHQLRIIDQGTVSLNYLMEGKKRKNNVYILHVCLYS